MCACKHGGEFAIRCLIAIRFYVLKHGAINLKLLALAMLAGRPMSFMDLASLSLQLQAPGYRCTTALGCSHGAEALNSGLPAFLSDALCAKSSSQTYEVFHYCAF